MYQNDLLSDLILNILALLVMFVFLGVIYAILYATFMFIFSGGNEEKIKKARNSIRYALMGFILTLIILFALPGFLRATKVPHYEKYTSGNIFKTAKIWVRKMITVFQSSSTPIDTTTEDYNL